MIRTDFHKTNHLFLSYPKKFYNDYERLVPFFNQLIHIIPDEIHLFIIVASKQVAQEIKDKFSYKNLDTILIKNWDEIWLRDCMGMMRGRDIIKPIYYPHYCILKNYWNYFRDINKLSRRIITESLSLSIIDLPLILDGGNFINNSSLTFLTDKVIEDNPGKRIEEMLLDYCGLKSIIVKKNDYDVIGHTDGYMAFKDDETAFISMYPKLKFLATDIEYTEYLCQVAASEGLKVIPIYDRPIDDPVDCGCKGKNKRSCYYSAKGTFINFIRLNNYIILPEYSMPHYQKEINYSKVNEDILADNSFNVIRINCDELSKFGGSLHCLSWQI